MNDEKSLKVFEAHGVVFSGRRGDQAYGLCPFTGKPDKFYVNVKTLLWDSKTAGLSGNVSKFLEHISEQYRRDLTPRHLAQLALDRKLPIEAFHGWEVGWTGTRYSILVRDARGVAVDLRLYSLGHRVLSTDGCHTGLLGAHLLSTRPSDPVFVCEGEWDAVALGWLLRKNNAAGVVVAVPGAAVFKQEWVPWFVNRTVHTCYDADEAGENGELTARKRLAGTVRTLTYVHWPEGVTSGFDVRDYVVYGAVRNKKPKTCWASLQRKFQPYPRKKPVEEMGRRSTDPGTPTRRTDQKSNWEQATPSLEDVVAVFRRWLYLSNTVGIEAMLATLVSQQIEGPPVWMFLVAPPGGAKTETLVAATGLQHVYLTSSLTPHSLISGANFKGDQDPSLIPALNGRVMIIKDFTSILSMRDAEKDEIFGILRDAYDGRCGKTFGTGVRREYESRFTILAGVTPRIYDLTQHHHSLGERFLKCTTGDNLVHESEEEIILKAIDNIERDTAMKWELQDVVTAFITKHGLDRPVAPGALPGLPVELKTKLVHLGMFGARLRGTVSRDQYRADLMTSRPSAEIGTRLGVQLAKFARSLALVHGRTQVTEHEYQLVKKVMLDTVNQRTEDMVRWLLRKCPTIDDTLSAPELAGITRYPVATVQRLLQDLDMLDVVVKTGTTYKYRWSLSRYIRDAIAKAGVYETEEELKRKTRRFVKVRRRRK
jgi:hypothetical protein